MKTVFDFVEEAHTRARGRSMRPGDVCGTLIDAKYIAVAVDPNKVMIARQDDFAKQGVSPLVRVDVIDVGYGVIRQVRFDSDNRAIYDIVLDEPIVTAIDQSRDWVARREELEEVKA